MTGPARLAWALFGLTLLLAVVQTWLFVGWSVVREDASSWPVLTFGLTLWAGLGAVIISRHPRHRVGWLFVVGALLAQVGNCLFDYDSITASGPSPDPAAIWPWAVWVAILLDAPVSLLFLSLLFLLFPTGHLPSPRWRPLLWATWVSFAGIVLAFAFVVPPWQIELENREEIFEEGWGAAPIAITLFVSLLVELLAAAASVVVRMRRARGVERQQLRWLAVSASMVAVCFVFAAFLPWQSGLLGWVRVLPLQLSVVAVVAGAALAILRYRLYDIDLVIRRTLVYTCLVAVLGAVYLGGIALLGSLSLSATGQSGGVAVTVTTLVVALAFQPLRRRIQRAIDRRFSRRTVDAETALRAFSGRLREEVDLDALCGDLLGVVDQTFQPRHASVWLRPPEQA